MSLSPINILCHTVGHEQCQIFCVSASCLLLPSTLDWLVRFSTFIDLNVFKLFLWMVSEMDRCFVINLSVLSISYRKLKLISNSSRSSGISFDIISCVRLLWSASGSSLSPSVEKVIGLPCSFMYYIISCINISADRVAGMLNSWFT